MSAWRANHRLLVGSGLLIALILLFFATRLTQREYRRRVDGARHVSVERSALARGEALLNDYAELDSRLGRYRIPIGQAIYLVASNPVLLEGSAVPVEGSNGMAPPAEQPAPASQPNRASGRPQPR
ncbi:MAG: hypothetical protein H6707_04915 [Deltaproteobacteria bacterium]|nr:hypothetical protein [Deltaproteobacteria bacterium]